MGSQTESVIPFTAAARSAGADGVDQVDKAGQTILGLLHKAAGVVEANRSQVSSGFRKEATQPFASTGAPLVAMRCGSPCGPR